MFIIEEELKKLPAKPGVYIMHGEKDEIIYVGKAISLKNRVRQYFQSSRNKGAKIERMVTHITRFEYIITDSELEALVLECNLIKEHRPKYNTMLKDDKSYPFIKVTVHEPYPRVLFCQENEKGQGKIFWPLYKRRSSKGRDRTGAEAVSGALLQPQSSERYRKGPALSVLSYETVQGTLPGICQPGRIPEEYQ